MRCTPALWPLAGIGFTFALLQGKGEGDRVISGLAGGPAPERQYMGSSLAARARAGAAAGGRDARLTCLL
jgi:hypothetical protein